MRRGFGFIELILVLAIISFLAYLAYKTYFPVMKQENIDGSNYIALKKSLENKVKDINRQAKVHQAQADDQPQ